MVSAGGLGRAGPSTLSAFCRALISSPFPTPVREPLFLLQRLVLVGFLQLIPHYLGFLRLLAATGITIAYTFLLLVMKPYKKPQTALLALCSQVGLTGLFIGALCLKLFNDVTQLSAEYDPKQASKLLGFSSPIETANAMIVVNVCILFIFGGSIIYQAVAEARTAAKLRPLLYVEDNERVEVPPIRTDAFNYLPGVLADRTFHLFLSHAWPAGQDVMKLVKARFRDMAPSVRVFLDVDDLVSGSGTAEVDHSRCILVYCMKVTSRCILIDSTRLGARAHRMPSITISPMQSPSAYHLLPPAA